MPHLPISARVFGYVKDPIVHCGVHPTHAWWLVKGEQGVIGGPRCLVELLSSIDEHGYVDVKISAHPTNLGWHVWYERHYGTLYRTVRRKDLVRVAIGQNSN